MSQLRDLYDDYTIDEDYHIEPYETSDVHVYDYEPESTHYEYTTPRSYETRNYGDEQVIERTTYLRDKVPFYGETTNRSEYTWNDPVFSKTKTYDNTSVERPNPTFYSETTNRAVYSPKVVRTVIERNQSEGKVERPHIPFYSDTTNRSEYVEKTVVRQSPQRKSSSMGTTRIPFESETTNTAEFTSKESSATRWTLVVSGSIPYTDEEQAEY
ncbi:hypothetical protein RB195_003045 [Necator americanus]|uniref:Uncharacterized protein n=1 Tax=Necator americanus TaxID=51031 RepID=A0ABR1DMF7_NECAM